MTAQEAGTLRVGDELTYTDLDRGIDHETVNVHPWYGEQRCFEFLWVTRHVEPVHRSRLERKL